MESPRWQVFADASALEEAAARLILDNARAAIHARGRFLLVLAGGTTPRRVYERLAAAAADWNAWRLYFGDERCLPAEHPERNSRMVRESWLDHVPLPPQHCHVIPAQRGAEVAARLYNQELEGVGEFDLTLLGLGEDGHTASLFPGQPWFCADAVAVENAPKPPPERVTLTPQRLARSRRVLFLATGAGKAAAVAAWRRGEHIPASRVRPEAGVEVYLDRAAAGEGTDPDWRPG